MGKKRTRRSAQQWQSLIEKHRYSNLSAPAFCKAQGIAYQSFMNWRKRLTQTLESAMGPENSFIELTPPAGAQASESASLGNTLAATSAPMCIELSLGGGIELRITRAL